jgi:hypothetical protein
MNKDASTELTSFKQIAIHTSLINALLTNDFKLFGVIR